MHQSPTDNQLVLWIPTSRAAVRCAHRRLDYLTELGNRSEHVLSMTGTAADVDAIVAAVIKAVANRVQARLTPRYRVN